MTTSPKVREIVSSILRQGRAEEEALSCEYAADPEARSFREALSS
jgi:hypothetical protein